MHLAQINATIWMVTKTPTLDKLWPLHESNTIITAPPFCHAFPSKQIVTYLNIILVLTVCKIQPPLSMFICHKFPQKLLWYQQISTMQHCSEIGGSAQIWCYFHCYKCCHMQVSCFKLTKLIKSNQNKEDCETYFLNTERKIRCQRPAIPHTRISSCNIKVPGLKFYFCLYSIPRVEVQLIRHNWYYQNMTHTHAHGIHINRYMYTRGATKVVPFFYFFKKL